MQRINRVINPYLILPAIAIVLLAGAQVRNGGALGSITSSEIEQTLNQRLDDYERRHLTDEKLAKIHTLALTDPDKLSESDRQTYVDYERMFFSGWEAAWKYQASGQFEKNRYKVWDTLFIEESNRRPPFSWTENKDQFSDGFVRHVEAAMSRH